jgi:hypothetical protein
MLATTGTGRNTVCLSKVTTKDRVRVRIQLVKGDAAERRCDVPQTMVMEMAKGVTLSVADTLGEATHVQIQ